LSKQVRTLLVVTVMSIVGMFSLMMIGQRYSKILVQRQDNPSAARRVQPASSAATRWGGSARPASSPPAALPATAEGAESSEEQAARYVEAFIEVRRALVDVSQALDRESNAEARLREARDVALGNAGIESGEYKQVRQLYARWASGSGQVSAAFEQAFEQRRDELESLRDERLESLDF